MSFFESLFRKEKKKESVILVDVGMDSVGGAYAVYEEGEVPVLVYAKRVAVQAYENELLERAMLRSLDTLGEGLLRDGAPSLARATGSGRAGGIAVSIGAPWQKSAIRIEHLEKKESFIFTRELVAEATKEDGNRAPGKLVIEEHMIGAILNGYKADDPFGKKVSRASIVVLASLIDERVAKHVTADLRELFHTEQFRVLPGSGLRLEALHAAFPHEEDALVMDVSSHEPSLGLIRNGLPSALLDLSKAAARHGWTGPLSAALSELAKRYPLPKTVFFLPGTDDTDAIQKIFAGAPTIRKLWLSAEPPKIIPLNSGHLSNLVRLAASVEPDLRLLLMALYHQAGD